MTQIKNLKWLIALLLITAIIIPVMATTPTLQRNKDTVLRGGDNGVSNGFMIFYIGNPDTTYNFVMVGTESLSIAPPEFDLRYSPTEQCKPIWITKGHYTIKTNSAGRAELQFKTTNLTTPMVYTFKVSDPLGNVSDVQIAVEVVDKIIIPTMIPTTAIPTPTPIPTPSTGTIIIQSSPAGGTIFLDNALKGIAPLTIQNLPNGIHTVRVRLDGYYDASKFVTVTGDSIMVELDLTAIPTPTPTPVITTIPTTAIPQGAAITQTEQVTTIKTPTPVPTATVNYSATIAALEQRVNEQQSWIDIILKFLGLK